MGWTTRSRGTIHRWTSCERPERRLDAHALPPRSPRVLASASRKVTIMTRVALAALSGSSERSRRLRCFQRASLLALAPAGSQTRGWIDFEAGALLLRYAVESSASLASEAETHGDLLLTPVADGGASCAARILVALRWSVPS